MIASCIKKGDPQIVYDRILEGFHPGELLLLVLQKGIELKVSPQEFLKRILGNCRRYIQADHGEGFWSDHWTYNLDLIESYLSVYPQALRSLLLEKKVFNFYHNYHYVLPRRERYLLTSKGVRQYHSVKDGSKELRGVIKDHQMRTQKGRGKCLLYVFSC